MKSHFLKENDVVLSSRWQFQDGRSKGMGTEWDQEVVGKVDPQKRVLCHFFLQQMKSDLQKKPD